MPGLLGILSESTPRIRVRVEAARERMTRHRGCVSDVISALDDRAWLADVRLEHLAHTLQNSGSGPSVAFHGILHNERALRSSVTPEPVAGLGALLAALYAREGAAFVERLEGEFSIAVLDPARRAMIVATDPIGNYPIYWHAAGQDFAFSSDLSALLRAVPEKNRLDLEAVADYLTLGAVLGDKTLVDGVRLLDPGTILEFQLDDARPRARRYFDVASFFDRHEEDKSRYLDAVQEEFRQSVDRAVSGTGAVGLSLSGGLDSRAILAAVNGRAGSLRTYTLGVAGCADQAIAKQLAHIAKTTHRFFELDASYLRDFLPNMAEMVSATDGLYLSHGLTEMLAMRFLDETGISVLLRGHGGELAKAHLAWPLHTDGQAYAARTIDEFLPHLARRANYVTPDRPLDRILTAEAARRAGTGALDSFRRAVAGTSLSPAEACSYLYLRELHRRFTVPSLELFRTKVEVRLPFVDARFLRVLLGAPAAWRDTTEIHRRIMQAGLPRVLEVRDSNTGAPVNAGATTGRVLDKVNSVLKMFNVKGYRHYHNFDEWMRLSLIESVEAELAGEFVRTRGIIAASTIRTLIDETARGTADHSYLLQVLLILELWMRQNKIEAAA